MHKSSKLLGSFMAYCADHPDQRFWQALRNWSGNDYIYTQQGGGHLVSAFNEDGEEIKLIDTFYL